MNVTNDSTNSRNNKESNLPSIKELYAAMAEVDLTRDAAEIMRYIVLLTAYGYASSPAAIEEQLRRRQFNTRLVACPFERDNLPANTLCVNPFQLDVDWRINDQGNEGHRCAFYLSLNLEGAESAMREYITYGCETEKDNYNRLRSDCGFLMISTGNGKGTNWNRSLLDYSGEVQAADDRAASLAESPVCVACGRFATNVCELRPLNCCPERFVCHETCWMSHMEDEHPEVPMDEGNNDCSSSEE